MATITINEVSKSYVYDIANSNYATVAMPITSMWGPGLDYNTVMENLDKLDQYADYWQSFNATQEGIEAFARAYRGASSLYRVEKDYSYQMALTLLASGYNVSTVRITQGGTANLYGNINQVTYFAGKLTKANGATSYTKTVIAADGDEILKLFNKAGNNGKTFEIGGLFGDYVNQATATVTDEETEVVGDVTKIVTPATVTFAGASLSGITITLTKGQAGDVVVPAPKSKAITIEVSVEGSAATWDSVSIYLWNEVSDKTWDGLGGNNPQVLAYDDVLANNGVAASLAVVNNSINLTITNPKEGTANPPAEGMYYIATVAAKYPGTFGNKLVVDISNKVYSSNKNIWNATTYIVQDNGGITPAESLNFVLDYEDSTDTLYYIDEISEYSEYIGSISLGNVTELPNFDDGTYECRLAVKVDGKGTDYDDMVQVSNVADKIMTALAARGYETNDDYYMAIQGLVDTMVDECYKLTEEEPADWADNYTAYFTESNHVYTPVEEGTEAPTWAAGTYYECVSEVSADANYMLDTQQKFTAFYHLADMLKDKLSFSPQFIIAGGWDDACVSMFDSAFTAYEVVPRVSPLHEKLIDVAYHSRCSCALIDIPRDITIDMVKTERTNNPGYVEKLSALGDAVDNLYTTHSALFTPWGRYTYVSMSRPVECAPSMEYLLIERAMIKNQATQYYWCLPTTRSHRLSFGKLDYKVSKSYLDSWQKEYGPDLNVITNIPSLGLSLWGNSTLYNTPVATYQALANLSTRLLVNAVEDLVYRCGIAITYQYNNNDAYSSFVAGVTPLLDTMVNVGAIDDYYVRMASGVNGLDSVKANEVVGLIYLVINGVINDITVDLVCLPAGTDLDQYRV